MFIGNSNGVVRIFDFKDSERKPLLSREMQGHEISCIDVHPTGNFVAVGTLRGLIGLWDAQKYNLVKTISGHNAPVLSLRFLKGANQLRIMWTDATGDVVATEFSKNILGYSANSVALLSDRFAFSLCELLPNDMYPSKLDAMTIVAIPGMNAVHVVCIEKEAKVLWEYKRPELLGKDVLPCVDWGRGALPEDPENANRLLAIGWDRVVQLVEIKEAFNREEGYAFNGYYESDYEIRALYWMAESVMLLVDSMDQVKILYTRNFAAGKYSETGAARDHKAAELEKPYRMAGPFVRSQAMLLAKQKQGTTQMQRTSCQQSVVRSGRQMLGLLRNEVLEARLYSWLEFLEEQRGKSQWIPALSVSIEIYSGNLKGFANTPERKEFREGALKAFMKEFIYNSLMQDLEKNKEVKTPTSLASTLTQIQTTIEYCIIIGETNMLLQDLFTLFSEHNLEEMFMDAMEPFILAGKFSAIQLPPHILKLVIDYYVRKSNFQTLEQALLCLCLDKQDLEVLAALCTKHMMLSALIYVCTVDNIESHFVQPLILMAKEMCVRRKDADKVKLDQILTIPKETEASCAFIGYKILWYIDLCFKGTKYPQRLEMYTPISFDVWPRVIYSIIDWLLLEENGISNVRNLMEFDLVCVLRIVSGLFENESTRGFISEPDKYGSESAHGYHYIQLLDKLKVVVDRIALVDSRATFAFNKMLAKIAAVQGIKLDPMWCVEVAKSLKDCEEEYDGTKIGREGYEKLILGMLRNIQGLQRKQIEDLIKAFLTSPYTEVLVYLWEQNGEYNKCFDRYLGSKDAGTSKRIFDWLLRISEVLSEASDDYRQLKTAIYEKLEKLVPP